MGNAKVFTECLILQGFENLITNCYWLYFNKAITVVMDCHSHLGGSFLLESRFFPARPQLLNRLAGGTPQVEPVLSF